MIMDHLKCIYYLLILCVLLLALYTLQDSSGGGARERKFNMRANGITTHLMKLHNSDKGIDHTHSLLTSISSPHNTFISPPVQDSQCRDGLCSEYLQGKDICLFQYCESRTIKKYNIMSNQSFTGKCHFIDGRERDPVALVSFPGSGNTWMRGLLEKATGICTGSIHCDSSLRLAGFNGEHIRSGAVLAVKTHFCGVTDFWIEREEQGREGNKLFFGSGLFIIRNPFHALISERNRRGSSSHVGHAVPEDFGGGNRSTDWDEFIKKNLVLWKTCFPNVIFSAREKNRPLYIVRYEDLQADTVTVIKNVLNFLGVSYSADDVEQRLAEDFTTFKRKKMTTEFEHFTHEQKSLVREAIAEAVSYLKTHNDGITFGIEDYLNT